MFSVDTHGNVMQIKSRIYKAEVSNILIAMKAYMNYTSSKDFQV
jgi:hypothetical protein